MIEYEIYSDDMKERALELLKQHWARDAPGARAFFEWRYESNPYVERPCIFVAKDRARLIGLRCFVVQVFRRGSDEILVACPADAVVHSDYRRQGIMRKLTENAFRHLEAWNISVILNLSANRYTAPLAKSLGSQEVGATRYLYRIRRGLRRGPGIAGFVRRNLETRAMPMHDLRPPACRHPTVSHDRFANIRDDAFYSWRYREPFAEFCYLHADNGASKGYLIVKKASKHMYSVMEYGCDNEHILRDLVEAFFKGRRRVCVLRLLDFGLADEDAEIFRRAGFAYEPRWLIRALGKHRVGIYVRLLSRREQGGAVLSFGEIVNAESWHIAPADVH